MKPHPRIRKTVKWGGAIFCVLSIAIWAFSARWYVHLPLVHPWWVTVAPGMVGAGWWIERDAEHPDAALIADWTKDGQPVQLRPASWWFSSASSPDARSRYVPLWMFIALGAGACAAPRFLDMLARRRARTGICPACNYNRTGLAPGVVCPECGAAPLTAPAKPSRFLLVKPHPRIRKTVKWGGAVICALSMAAWCVSLRWSVSWYVIPEWEIGLAPGIAGFEWMSGRDWTREVEPRIELWKEVSRVPGYPRVAWRFGFREQSGVWTIAVPLWTPAVGGAIFCVIGWWQDVVARRRVRAGKCPKCRYNRTGLAPGAVCPECGASSPAAS